MCINHRITNMNPPSFGGPPMFRWTATLDGVYVSVMQLRDMWDSPLLKAFSDQYPSFPLLLTISIAVHPSSSTKPAPPPPSNHPSPTHTKTFCPDPFAPWGSTVLRRSTVSPSITMPLL